MSERRTMKCPFCGHTTTTTQMIGAMACGPHQLSDGTYEPARQMVEIKQVRALTEKRDES